ncbi:MAG: MAPEG family protein [Myxococcota bacterium]|nr:MAPEG family protein [Myxococcota bacterium]
MDASRTSPAEERTSHDIEMGSTHVFMASFWYTVPGTLALTWAAYTWIWPNYAGPATLAGRMAFALQCIFFAFLPVAATSMTVVIKRVADGAHDPLRGYESRSLRIHSRVLQSHIQQFIWFAVCTLALSTRFEGSEMRLLPVVAGIFLAARFLYWFGFATGDPIKRSPGAQITLTINVAMLLLTAFVFAVRGVS